jgi:hypothetical protein
MTWIAECWTEHSWAAALGGAGIGSVLTLFAVAAARLLERPANDSEELMEGR